MTTYRLNNNDYKKILEFYNKKIPTSNRELKKQAENLIISNLCRCIKKVDKNNEARSIGICTKSIINNKGFVRGSFTCKKKQTIRLKKKHNKTKKNKK